MNENGTRSVQPAHRRWLKPPALAGITIFAHDEAWGQAFAQATAVQDALTRLIRGQDNFVFRQVHVRPDTVFLKLYRANKMLQFDVEAAQIAEWSEALLQLAEAQRHFAREYVFARFTP